MNAKIILKKEEFLIQEGIAIRSVLEEPEIQPEYVIPTKDGKFVPEDSIIKERDVIRLVAVISGG